MDRLIADKIEKEEKTSSVVENLQEKGVESTSNQKQQTNFSIKIKESSPQEVQNEYLNSFKDVTVADIKKQEEEKKQREFKQEKEVLIQEQFKEVLEPKTEKKVETQTKQEVSQKIIEKPNYDFIEENKKIVKLKTTKQQKDKKKSRKKMVAVALSCALGVSAIVCVANTVAIEDMSANYLEIDETYQMNLAKYLKKIYNLDASKTSLEMIETFPDEVQSAGDFEKHSNWFDRFCNFIGGIFGG